MKTCNKCGWDDPGSHGTVLNSRGCCMICGWSQAKELMSDDVLISQIAKRYNSVLAQHGINAVDHLSMVMDIEGVHKVMPLNLHALLAADVGDFAHDVGGIFQHFDRASRTVADCFVPRFACPD